MRDIEKYTNDYVNQLGFEKYQVMYRQKTVVHQILKYKHAKILEVGCGLSPLFLNSDLTYEDYTIVEPSAFFCDNAQTLAKNTEQNISIHNCLFEDFSNKNNHNFDIIVISSLIHELEKYDSLLNRAFEIASPSTVIHINTPNAKSFHLLLAKHMGLINSIYEISPLAKTFQRNHTFDINSLTSTVESFGFEAIDRGSYFIKPFTHHQMQKLIEHDIITNDVLNGLHNLVSDLPEIGSEIFVDVVKKARVK